MQRHKFEGAKHEQTLGGHPIDASSHRIVLGCEVDRPANEPRNSLELFRRAGHRQMLLDTTLRRRL